MKTRKIVVCFMALVVVTSALAPGHTVAQAQTIKGSLEGSLDGGLPRISGPLSVQQAVDTALKGNLDVQAMQSEAAAASQETRAARAMTRPQVSANTYLSASSMPALLGSSPGVTPANTFIAPGRTIADQNLTLMVPLYTGGRLSSLVKAASGRESAAKAGIATAQADAALMVRGAYYRVLFAAEMVKVAQARLDAATEMVRVTKVQFEVGKTIEATVARAEAEQADAQRMLTTARNDQAKMLLDLKRAMGVRLDSEITLSDALTIGAYTSELSADLTEALRVRPELASSRARVDAAAAQLDAAKGSVKPQIYGSAMADAFAPGDMGRYSGATVALSMSFPLIDGGQRRAEIGQMEAMRRRSEAEQKDMQLRVAAEVRQARLDVESAEQNYRTAQAAVQSSQTAYDVIVLRVQNQKAILVEQLDALAALIQTRTNLAQSLFEHSVALARLRRAIGRP
jgi:outer membrane protein